MQEQKQTIWGMDETPAREMEDTLRKNYTKKIVICPKCASRNDAANGTMPFSCNECGYLFQDGIDRIVDAENADSAKKIANKPDNIADGQRLSADDTKGDAGPLRRVARDVTSLRISAIGSNCLLPEEMKETGNIIGRNGTVFRNFQADQQISIWHTAAGWYARATIGNPLYNGVPMNQGIQIRLSTGDLLVLDQEQFMLEIF